jgi:cytochrome c553
VTPRRSPPPTPTPWPDSPAAGGPGPSVPDRRRWGLALVALAAIAAALGVRSLADASHPAAKGPPPAPNVSPVPRPATPSGVRYPVHIRQPIVPPRVDTGLRDPRGQPITTSCASCHATSPPRPDTRAAAELDEFHQGLTYAHGDLSCLSCHHAGDYDRLRLADGRRVEFPEAMQLCAQCHGPQYRDYRHGSHGGMTGHWDLRRGPRERNHCVDCHDPHAPAFPLVRPVFEPAPDRGLAPSPRPSHD